MDSLFKDGRSETGGSDNDIRNRYWDLKARRLHKKVKKMKRKVLKSLECGTSNPCQVSTEDAEALLRKQLQDLEYQRVRTGTLSVEDLKKVHRNKSEGEVSHFNRTKLRK